MFKILLVLFCFIASICCVTYDDNEALLIALDKSGALLDPPIELYNQIHHDLAVIRAANPSVANIKHTSSWTPGQLICTGVTRTAAMVLASSEFGPISEKAIGTTNIEVITFGQKYNSPVLAKLLKSRGLISTCEVDTIIGLSSDVTLNADNSYTFYKGSGDCMSGCISKQYWIFTVDGEKVTLVKTYNDTIV